MGGRFSRAVTPHVRRPTAAATKPVVETSAASPAPDPPPVQLSNDEFVPPQDPLEHRDTQFEAQLHQLAHSISSEELIFVKGSDPKSAEEKRKKRREMRQQMLRRRLTTAQFKEILLQLDATSTADRDAWIRQLAEKYEVDGALLAQALRYYRFPKMTKRYDGYIVADSWL